MDSVKLTNLPRVKTRDSPDDVGIEYTEDVWENLFQNVAAELANRISRRYYSGIVIEMKKLSTPAEKLVYLYLALFQPQTFSTLRRGLQLHETTIVRVLKILKERGFIIQGENYFWWLAQSLQLEG